MRRISRLMLTSSRGTLKHWQNSAAGGDVELLMKTGAGQPTRQHGKPFGKLSRKPTTRASVYALTPSKQPAQSTRIPPRNLATLNSLIKELLENYGNKVYMNWQQLCQRTKSSCYRFPTRTKSHHHSERTTVGRNGVSDTGHCLVVSDTCRYKTF